MNTVTKPTVFWPTIFFQRNIKEFSLLLSALLRGDTTQEKSIKGLIPDLFSAVQMNKEDS